MSFFKIEKEALSRQKADVLLFSAVETYMQSINQGNYDPELPEVDWSAQEKSAFIKTLLNNAPKFFENLDVPKSITSNIPCIAHLLASLTILTETITLSSDEKLTKLKEICALPQVEAGMPGPCLIYMNAVLMSTQYNEFAKICLLSGIINNIKRDMNKFGDLGAVVLSETINQWFSIENVLDSRKQSILSNDKETYRQLQDRNSQKSKEEMTFIDQCIIQVWKNLKIDLQDQPNSQIMGGQLNY